MVDLKYLDSLPISKKTVRFKYNGHQFDIHSSKVDDRYLVTVKYDETVSGLYTKFLYKPESGVIDKGLVMSVCDMMIDELKE